MKIFTKCVVKIILYQKQQFCALIPHSVIYISMVLTQIYHSSINQMVTKAKFLPTDKESQAHSL